MRSTRHHVVAAVAAIVSTTSMASCADGPGPSAAVTTRAESAPAPTSTTTTTTAASPTQTVSGEGFSLELPTTWQAYELSGDGLVEPVGAATTLPGGVGGLAIASALQGGNLFGVAPADAGGQSATVVLTSLGSDHGAPTADLSDTLRDRMAAEGISDLVVAATELHGRPAARATFRHVGETGIEQEAVTVYVPGERTSYLLSFSVPLPARDDFQDVINAIIDSLRVS